ncbi:MAG: hypothetical protein IJ224_04330 [Lachnospiraceae bacterium]|nr:hypothetical protein [Lachnospiraceae bacterium]MBQ9277844.1 hypothetical protein [Lachnospiraceae bacterium]
MPWWGILLIVIVVALGILFALYKVGDKLQKKQIEQKEQMADAAQPATMLIIDKKYLPMKDAGLPKMVMEQTPKKYHKAKLPIVKAKVGPQIMNFICDDAIFEDVPTKGEVKAMVSGIYIVSVKSVRGKKKAAQVEEETNGKKKKKSMRQRMQQRQAEYQKQINDEILAKKQNKAKGIDQEKTKEQIKKEKERAKKIKDGIK